MPWGMKYWQDLQIWFKGKYGHTWLIEGSFFCESQQYIYKLYAEVVILNLHIPTIVNCLKLTNNMLHMKDNLQGKFMRTRGDMLLLLGLKHITGCILQRRSSRSCYLHLSLFKLVSVEWLHARTFTLSSRQKLQLLFR